MPQKMSRIIWMAPFEKHASFLLVFPEMHFEDNREAMQHFEVAEWLKTGSILLGPDFKKLDHL